MIYKNGQLDKVSTENGYIDFSGASPLYHYYLPDHLANNRVVLSAGGAVEQVNHYYPFGGLMAEGSGSEVQPRKFGGKELDTSKELNLSDFGSRQYDALLPRFTSANPMQEKRYSVSPYAYCSNNPVLRVDPDGRDDYRLDRCTGAITHFVSTEDKYDRILAFDAKGKIREIYQDFPDPNAERTQIPFEKKRKDFSLIKKNDSILVFYTNMLYICGQHA